jgi:hypothetical protein
MRIEAFLLCDDIRHELGGKQTIVGVFGDTLQFDVPVAALEQWPKAVKLGIYVRLALEQTDKPIKNLTFTLDALYGTSVEKLGSGTLPLWQNTNTQKVNIAFIQNPLLLHGEGTLTIQITCYADGTLVPLDNSTTTLQIVQKALPTQ